MSNLKVLLVLLVRVMSMSMQNIIRTEAMKGKDGTMKGKDGTTDGMMNTPDTSGFTINAITGLRIISSGFYARSVTSAWLTQI
jgi:hypothetical protein